jgi:FAD/FMN-containing dehydrogenase
MQPFTSDQSYQNFIDGAETDYLRAYYGANLERLVEVKRKYDPGNLFRFPQSIPLSL